MVSENSFKPVEDFDYSIAYLVLASYDAESAASVAQY